MSVKRNSPTAVASKKKQKDFVNKNGDSTNVASTSKEVLVEPYLAPLPLVAIVLICSGCLWVLGLRDMMATGKIMLGDIDQTYLEFTKSMDWYSDSNGWKSTQGGLSTVQAVTTDANNMGGLFVRKLAGGAALAAQTHKLMPLLFHPLGAKWTHGHFRPLLATAIIANLATIIFHGIYLEDFTAAGAQALPVIVIVLLATETVVLLYYLLLASTSNVRGPAIVMKQGKTEKSLVSRIVTRTVAIVSTVMSIIAGRDLFFTGQILHFIPRDDIYLEWTGAFLHSPPQGSPEAADQGLEAPLYIGDKFMAQLLALNVLVLCLYKFVSAMLIRYGSDGSGEIVCRMIWKSAAIGGVILTLLFRIFTPAAQTASLDFRWHLMSVAYETFILGLYGFM